ncbi:flagellar basal-body rod protein FlgC [Rhizobium sp. BK650]|uniref:flagellar basal body rod C-terminal domain-containing protein n=1 Tax=Rhizobium sp. BK650 TaxID=2586990 RepID=UPI0016111D6F|nr:flagellar basal body protein [Rhizobium sp. BK650]MBB3657100.1 flagellar basal-body rod protein FlgC [Rhizobium sp. BK650]
MSISAITHTALSGMLAQTSRASAIAKNVANASTPGYGRLNTSFQSVEPSGVQVSVNATDQGVDFATELTDLIETEQSYKANASVFETGADLWDVLMSMKRD